MKFRILKHLRLNRNSHILYPTRLIGIRKWSSKYRIRVCMRKYGLPIDIIMGDRYGQITGCEIITDWKQYLNDHLDSTIDINHERFYPLPYIPENLPRYKMGISK